MKRSKPATSPPPIRIAPAPTDQCATCRGVLAIELLSFTAHLPGEDHQLCPDCAVALVQRLAAHHQDALEILEEVWRLPSGAETPP